MASKSKNKGKGFERQVAKLLSDALGGWWTRVPNSGAFFGGANAYRKESADGQLNRIMSGDIIVPQEFSGMEVECKSRAAFNFMHLLRSEGNKEINEWIKQTWQHDPKVGLLIFKANNTPIFVCHRQPELIAQTQIQLTGSWTQYHFDGQTYFIHEASQAWLQECRSKILNLLAN